MGAFLIVPLTSSNNHSYHGRPLHSITLIIAKYLSPKGLTFLKPTTISITS